MAKAPKKPTEPEKPITTRMIKVTVQEDDHRKLRVAAALTNVTVSEFTRKAAVAAADKTIEKGF